MVFLYNLEDLEKGAINTIIGSYQVFRRFNTKGNNNKELAF